MVGNAVTLLHKLRSSVRNLTTGWLVFLDLLVLILPTNFGGSVSEPVDVFVVCYRHGVGQASLEIEGIDRVLSQ